MVFKHRGGCATLEEGFGSRHADLLYPPFTSRVHGVLYQLTRDDFSKLQQREGGYVSREMQVETYDGTVVWAQVFVSEPLAKLPAEVQPTEQYMRLLREGASFNYLDPLYQAWLSSIETVPSVGLGPEYYNTPARHAAYAAAAAASLALVACMALL